MTIVGHAISERALAGSNMDVKSEEPRKHTKQWSLSPSFCTVCSRLGQQYIDIPQCILYIAVAHIDCLLGTRACSTPTIRVTYQLQSPPPRQLSNVVYPGQSHTRYIRYTFAAKVGKFT